jgi:hypothetical protein
LGVHSSEIGRNGEDFAARSEFVEGEEQVRPHFFCGHFSRWAAGGEEKAHVVLILLPGGGPGRVLEGVCFLGIWQKKYWRTEGAVFAVLLVFLMGVGETMGVF